MLINLGITVALQFTSYTTAEIDGPLSICVQMFIGNLERAVSLSASTADGTAIGTYIVNTHKLNTTLIFRHEKIIIRFRLKYHFIRTVIWIYYYHYVLKL